MYTTMVLIVSNIVRGYFTGIFSTIMFDDLPNVDRVLQVRFSLICEWALYRLASTVQHGDNSSSVRHAKERSMTIIFNAAWPTALQKYMFLSSVVLIQLCHEYLTLLPHALCFLLLWNCWQEVTSSQFCGTLQVVWQLYAIFTRIQDKVFS